MISLKKWLAVRRAKRLQRQIWKVASKPIIRVIGEWGGIPGSELFPTHSWFAKFLDRVGFSKLKAWFTTEVRPLPLSQIPTEYSKENYNSGGLVLFEAYPETIPTLDHKVWWKMEQRLRFNPNLEAKLLQAKTEEEATLIARVHWTSGRGPEASPQGSGRVS